MIYEPELETLPRKQLRALQTEHLRALLAHVKERAPLYRERLADVEPGDIASVDDLGRLPFTRKDDLRESILTAGMASDQKETIRDLCRSRSTNRSSCATSATTSRGTASSPSLLAGSERTSSSRSG